MARCPKFRRLHLASLTAAPHEEVHLKSLANRFTPGGMTPKDTWNRTKNNYVPEGQYALRTCHVLVPPQVLVYATFRWNATGLFQLNAECLRRGLWKPLMYWKLAASACGRVCHDCRQISSAVIVLKNVSTGGVVIAVSIAGRRYLEAMLSQYLLVVG